MPFTPILASVNRLIRYHLGTVAKGSFIITLVKIPRMILMYIHSQLKGKVRKNLFWTFCGHIPDLSSARSKIPNDIKSKCECFLPCPCQVESNSVPLSPTLVLYMLWQNLSNHWFPQISCASIPLCEFTLSSLEPSFLSLTAETTCISV